MFTKCVIVAVLVAYCLALPSAEDKKAHNSDSAALDLRAFFLTGYFIVEDTRNGTNYLVSTIKKVNYFMAQSFCKNLDMRLFEIDSPAKTEIIKSLIKDYIGEGPLWVGADRLADGRTWTWATNNTPVTYFNWGLSDPNNAKGDEMCIEVYHDDAVWDDQRCTEEIYFICETQDKKSFIANFKGLL